MRELLDIKVFVEPHEDLKNYWKIQRDQQTRGYSREEVLTQIQNRQTHSQKYIAPQRNYADWIVSYRPEDPDWKESSHAEAPSLSVRHIVRNDLGLEGLVNFLKNVKTLKTAWDFDEDMEQQILDLQGTISSEHVKEIAFKMFPNLYEMVGSEDIVWNANLDGIAQLILLSFVNEVLEGEVALKFYSAPQERAASQVAPRESVGEREFNPTSVS